MCWNEPVSWASFAVGTICNLAILALYRHNSSIVAVCLIWQWVLMMQFFEALAWRSSSSSSSAMSTVAANGALIFNVTQPIVIFIILILLSSCGGGDSGVGFGYKAAAAAVCMCYIMYLIYSLNNAKGGRPYTKLEPSESCGQHLDLHWWNDFKWGPVVFLATVVVLLLLLLRPMDLAVFEILFIVAALGISLLFYTCSGTGSLWCWLVVLGPVVTVLYFEASRRLVGRPSSSLLLPAK